MTGDKAFAAVQQPCRRKKDVYATCLANLGLPDKFCTFLFYFERIPPMPLLWIFATMGLKGILPTALHDACMCWLVSAAASPALNLV